jgi:ankyrin repeat protein
MANVARPRRQKPQSRSSLPEDADSGTRSQQRADNERARILKFIVNDDADAVARWISANVRDGEVALLPNDPLNNSVMHMVAFQGKLSTLRMMWTRGMKCSHRNLHGETALHWAIKCPDEDAMRAVVRELLTIGAADVDASTSYGDTPLFYAIADGKLAAVMELCERGASLDLLNADGDAPIHVAISSGDMGIVAYILERNPGAAQMRDGLSRLPIQLALEFGNEDIIKAVLLAWPLCLGCRTPEGVLLHDVFPHLGLLHLVEGLGFGDECLWGLVLDDTEEMQQFNVDVTISGTTFFIEGHQSRGSASFEVQLNDLQWVFDDPSLSAFFSNSRGEQVLHLIANTPVSHKKLMRQLDLARLSVSSYVSSTKNNVENFKVLSLKKSSVPNPTDYSDSEASVESGRIHLASSVKQLGWLQQLDDQDVDLMIKWGVVSPENVKAVLINRKSKARDGDIILKNKTDGRAAQPDSLEHSSELPVAPPPPRRRTKAAAVISAAHVPQAPPSRGAKNKGGVAFIDGEGSHSAIEAIEPPLLVLNSHADLLDDEPPPPPPPAVVNHARLCADNEETAIRQLQAALETGKIHSGIMFRLVCTRAPNITFFVSCIAVEGILIDRPWLANALIPPSNEPLLVCASRAANIGTFFTLSD